MKAILLIIISLCIISCRKEVAPHITTSMDVSFSVTSNKDISHYVVQVGDSYTHFEDMVTVFVSDGLSYHTVVDVSNYHTALLFVRIKSVDYKEAVSYSPIETVPF